jgi:hypothetical protein
MKLFNIPFAGNPGDGLTDGRRDHSHLTPCLMKESNLSCGNFTPPNHQAGFVLNIQKDRQVFH